MKDTHAVRTPFSRRHPGAYLALWVIGTVLVLIAFTGHYF